MSTPEKGDTPVLAVLVYERTETTEPVLRRCLLLREKRVLRSPAGSICSRSAAFCCSTTLKPFLGDRRLAGMGVGAVEAGKTARDENG
jgi:proline racemase